MRSHLGRAVRVVLYGHITRGRTFGSAYLQEAWALLNWSRGLLGHA